MNGNLIEQLKNHVSQFDFAQIFQLLGWNHGRGKVRIEDFEFDVVAEMGGVPVLLCLLPEMVGAQERKAVADAVNARHRENVLIFCDAPKTQAVWRWQRDEKNAREHVYFRGQPGDLFVAKIAGLAFDFEDFEKGQTTVVDVARRLKNALDVESVTKKFFELYKDERLKFIELIRGVDNPDDKKHYATLLLNRILFVWFMQKKGFLDNGDVDYLVRKLDQSQQTLGPDRYYDGFLKPLFFEGFALPEDKRRPETQPLLGTVPYLNGGLFLPHRIEAENAGISIPDAAFRNVFALLAKFSWNLNDAPGGNDDEMRPDILGYIFEKYINQKEFGAYYTLPEITEYLCEETIHRQLLKRVNCPDLPGNKGYAFDSVEEMLLKADEKLCERIIEALPKISVLDPACGSGAFLVAALKTLVNLYSAVYGKAMFLQAPKLQQRIQHILQNHPSLEYFIRKTIIVNNLYGVDIMEEAVEIARLRLFVSLVACAKKVQDVEPLPNIDFNIMTGNSLVGLMKIEDAAFGLAYQKTGQNLFGQGHVGTYRQIVQEKQRLLQTYKNAESYLDPHTLAELKQQIETNRQTAQRALDQLLLENMHHLGVKYEQAQWNEQTQTLAKPLKRNLSLEDVQKLKPFHWAFEFPEIFQNGGFDVVVGNPPWENLKPEDKEFFMKISPKITKNSMTIKDFEKEMESLVKDSEVRQAYLDYLSQFPHQSAYFRAAQQFQRQSSTVNGKKTGSDVNLYKLFFEQFYNLAKDGGEIGIVVPSGIYTDLGAKGLREMLFEHAQLHAIFGFQNRKPIFEGVFSLFKFALLTFEKGGKTNKFRAAFMRAEPSDLNLFRKGKIGLEFSVDGVRKFSPETHSLIEFKNPLEIQIAEKALRFPLLGKQLPGMWNVKFTTEFIINKNNSHLFETEPGPGKLPLF
ncbi:MAG: ATP-binding protein, partial [Bacteroidia bacterium]|nr:ATP-binding protein [Bacteroidia bacterium]